jgi:hypothetical protein
MTDPARAAAFSSQHLCLALRAGEPQRIARGLTIEMGIAPATGEAGFRWASKALPVAERLSERHGAAYHRGLFLLAQGHVAYLNGEWRAALEWLRHAEKLLRASERRDVQWALLSCNTLSTIAAVLSGDLAGVGQRMPAVLAEARQRSDLHGIALLSYPRVLWELACDRPDEARKLCEEAACCKGGPAQHLRDFTSLHASLLVDRYVGDAAGARARIERHWPTLVGSKLLVVNIVRVSALAERGSAALSALTPATRESSRGSSRESSLRLARSCADDLDKERLAHAQALSGLLHAHLAQVQGEGSRALSVLTDVTRRLDSAGMSLHGESARRCVGGLMGGEVGKLLVAEADAALSAQGVRDPERFANMMVPGFSL